MKNTRLTLILIFMLFYSIAWGQNNAKSVFDNYYQKVQKFATDFPREKAHLHFDNTSYYVGDTIWFKAYVTLAANQQYSKISRPLYVELIDQNGHITDMQIVKLKDGQGDGQFILSKSMFSGYYEVRAYTRWMLAFDEPEYFSRTLPIYRFAGKDKIERNLTTYSLSPDMVKRPIENKDKLSLRFFPEGGNLIEDIETKIAFKAESRDSGNVSISGVVELDNGQKTIPFETMHDGMGYFLYTPSKDKAYAKVVYRGKDYKFQLPKALSNGYALKTECNAGALIIGVSCNKETAHDTLAVFVSHQGMPYLHQLVTFGSGNEQRFVLPVRKLPAGVLQVSLINTSGNTLCERFVFSNPSSPLQIIPDKLRNIYSPYAPITCELQVNNSKGEPSQQTISVSVRDAVRSDYFEYDNNIFTDMLLTSDLKGYINKPGYYFSSPSMRKQIELDLLMMIHGWRKYDMTNIISSNKFMPKQMPESQLALSGQVKSTLFNKNLKDIALSAMVMKNEEMITGATVTDEDGRFKIPMEDFEGISEALIQTKKVGKERTKDASIFMDRNFSPSPKALDYDETHPEYKDMTSWQNKTEKFDALFMDSIRKAEGIYVLDDVVIKSKRFSDSNMSTKISEKSIYAYYDVRRSLDELRDKGKVINTIPEFMEIISPQFYWNHSDDTYTFHQKPICYVMDNKILSDVEVKMMITEIDGLSSIIVSNGVGGLSEEIVENSKASEVSDTSGVDISKLDKYCVFYLTPTPRHDVINKSQTAVLGTRLTLIQGYAPHYECYSPAYPNRDLYMDKADRRRTIYWNPSLNTDENGKAIIKCYNNQYSTPLIIDVETLSPDGKIGSLKYSTIDENIE